MNAQVTQSRVSLPLRLTAVLLAVACLMGFLGVCQPTQDIFYVQAQDSTVDDLNAQKDDLESRQEELAAQRDETASTLEEQQQQSDIIREQIEAKSSEIAVNEQLLTALNEQIADKENEIADKEAALNAMEASLAAQYDTLRARLRAISKKSALASLIQVLFNQKSFADYLIGFKMTERVSMHDQAMMDRLEADMKAVEESKNVLKDDKAVLEIERTQVASVQSDMEADKDSLQVLYDESEALADEMAQNIEDLDAQIAAIAAQQQALQDEINAVLDRIRAEEEEARKEAEENGDIYEDLIFTGSGDGSMIWPAPTCPVITSSFKWRESTKSWHRGLDIACYGDAEGEPIVAAADGVVYVANDYDEYGMGYGYYMMIDHGYDANGQRIITTYAHCSRIDISEGDTVTAGQQIGLVGNTGKSYGAHLHFEVSVDGVAVDPVSNGYLSTDGIDVLA